MNLISEKTATYSLLFILGAVVVFHLFVLIGVVPYEIVWGGRLDTRSEMIYFETFSIVINLIMLAVVAMYADIIRVKINKTILKGALWMMFILFLINTLGNILSNDPLERAVFTPLTIILAMLSFRLAMGKGK